jgi:hypothetical protein
MAHIKKVLKTPQHTHGILKAHMIQDIHHVFKFLKIFFINVIQQ